MIVAEGAVENGGNAYAGIHRQKGLEIMWDKLFHYGVCLQGSHYFFYCM